MLTTDLDVFLFYAVYFTIGFFFVHKFLNIKYRFDKQLNNRNNIEHGMANVYLTFLMIVWPLVAIYLFCRLCIRKIKLINLKTLRLKK